MIDYEKLKLAHEICSKLNDHYFSIDFCVNTKSPKYDISITYANDGISVDVSDIDELIIKLQELAKPEPKYKAGLMVWHIVYGHEFVPISGLIMQSDIGNKNLYQVNGNWWPEEQLFPTRQALIEHQIKYWKSLRECQHEYTFESGFSCNKCEML